MPCSTLKIDLPSSFLANTSIASALSTLITSGVTVTGPFSWTESWYANPVLTTVPFSFFTIKEWGSVNPTYLSPFLFKAGFTVSVQKPSSALATALVVIIPPSFTSEFAGIPFTGLDNVASEISPLILCKANVNLSVISTFAGVTKIGKLPPCLNNWSFL